MENYPDEKHFVKILDIQNVTHNVKKITISKPRIYEFTPGQATDVTIDLPDWKSKRNPFTFTSLNNWKSLEFTIKIYEDHNSVTNELGKLNTGDQLIIHDAFGAIQYKGEGVFIAGGAGVTPFIAIFRQLYCDNKIGSNKLIFSNKTSQDIILKEEFEKMLGNQFINTLTQEDNPQYEHRKIDESYLREKIKNLDQYFYICGPDPMVEDIHKDLLNLGVKEEKIVIEQF